jgi:diguanylate cyclase (GGDEF)-like protein/PAS domain S-box-containing protein
MLGEVFNQRIDFIFFINGLGLLFTAAFAFRLYKKHQLLHWLWFSLFCLAMALASALVLLSLTDLAPNLTKNLCWSLADLGLLFLALYGLFGQPKQGFRLAGYILVGILLVAPAAGALYWGMQGFVRITLFGLAPVSGLLALLAIFRHQDRRICNFVPQLYPLLAAYVILLCLIPGIHLLVRIAIDGWEFSWQPFPVGLYAVPVAVAAAGLAISFAHSAAFGSSSLPQKDRSGLHAYIIGLSAVGFALFFGFTLTEILGDRAEQLMRKELFMRSTAVANALDPGMVAELKSVPEDINEPYYKQLIRQLTKIRRVNQDLRFIYIAQLRTEDRKVLMALDIEPPSSKNYAPPGLVYEEAPQELIDIFTTGKAVLVGPYTDRWGTWVSGLTPIKNELGVILGVLGMDVSAKSIRTAVIINRSLGITITFLLSLIGAVLALITQRNKDLRVSNTRLSDEIAEHERTQESLAESEEKFRNLVERANDGIAILQDHKVAYANPRLSEMMGLTPEMLLHQPLESLVVEDQRAQFMQLYRHRLRGEDTTGGYETTLTSQLGTGIPVEINAGITPFNSQPAVLIIARDITERKKALEELAQSEERYKKLSISDDLTGLYNSRYFYNQLQNEITRTERYHRQLSLALMDIDDFKELNDLHGHLEGDRYLAELGRLIQGTIRETDSAFRYGGEEFALILPETDGEEAMLLAERVRLAISSHLCALANGSRVSKTVSMGVAQHRQGEDLTSFVKRTDQNLYQAKDQGKNRTVFS